MVLAGQWEDAQVYAKQHYSGWDFGEPMTGAADDDADADASGAASSSAGGKGDDDKGGKQGSRKRPSDAQADQGGGADKKGKRSRG